MNRWFSAHIDFLVLGMLLAIYLSLGLSRLEYAGDGLRHLDHILRWGTPALGEPRWILFPLVLFILIKPLVAIGMVVSVDQAALVFVLFNTLCGFVYLVCLRSLLPDLSAGQRAAALLLAGGSSVLLILATDTLEPVAAASIVLIGLSAAKYRTGVSDVARITIAVAFLSLASLVYQGLLFGLFLLPTVFPMAKLATRQFALRIAALVVAVPLVTVGLVVLNGDTPRNAVRRFVEGEANVAASRRYSAVTTKNLIGVAVVGPAYAFASIPELRGLAGSLSLLSDRRTVVKAAAGAVAWLSAALAICGAIVLLLIRRQFALLGAFAGVMALPALRMAQYSYVKYYVLLPMLAVLVVQKLRVRFAYVGLLGSLLLVSNVVQLWGQRADIVALRAQTARDLYPRLSRGTCFLTSGWGPPISDWRGESLAWAHVLYGGNSESQAEIANASRQVLVAGLKGLFCNCPAVVTDTFIKPNLKALEQELLYFHVPNIPISTLIVQSPEIAEIFRTARFSIYQFSAGDQRQACRALE